MTYRPYELAGYLAPYGDTPHLFAVMNDPCRDGLCLTLMMSSVKEGRTYDDTCVLDVGDHEFIRKPTAVVYRLATTFLANHICNMIEKGVYIPKEDWDTAVFNRIARGIYDSLETPQGMMKYAEKNGI